jgi:hypothetical protein
MIESHCHCRVKSCLVYHVLNLSSQLYRQPYAKRTNPIVVTGGAGFIGSNFILQWLASERSPVVNFDKLTYAGNLGNLDGVSTHPGYAFVHGDICDRPIVSDLLQRYRPRALVHFAAESHVDRSIHGPDDFVRTNVNAPQSDGPWFSPAKPGRSERFISSLLFSSIIYLLFILRPSSWFVRQVHPRNNLCSCSF